LVEERDLGPVEDVVQVSLQLGLAVDDHVPVDETPEVDAQEQSAERQVDAVVDETLGVHSLADADVPQQLGGAVLYDPCSHPTQHVVAAAPLHDNAVDPLQVEEVGEHRARGSSSDDRYLRPNLSHGTGYYVRTPYARAHAERRSSWRRTEGNESKLRIGTRRRRSSRRSRWLSSPASGTRCRIWCRTACRSPWRGSPI